MINNDTTISSNAVTFWFQAEKGVDNNTAFFLFWPYSIGKFFASILPNNERYQYECSFDGQPFEDCNSPKPYGDLITEVHHNFQVRTKGILGNTQEPATSFKFISLTASVVKGIIEYNGEPIVNANIKVGKLNDIKLRQTDSVGGFLFRDIRQGHHEVEIDAIIDNISQRYNDTIYIPRASEWKELNLILEKINSAIFISSKTVQAVTKNNFNQDEINPNFRNTTSSPEKDISIEIQSQNISKSKNEKLFKTKLSINASQSILDTIDNVSYYLHPTFKPSIINSTNRNENFSINLNNWGVFTINAKVFFNDNTTRDIELPIEKWLEVLRKDE